MLCYYLDDFIAIFKVREAMSEKMTAENKTYIQLTNLLSILRNNSKNAQGLAVLVFDIKVDQSCFTTCLPKEKLDKATWAIAKVLNQKSVYFIDMQSLVGFLLFCLQAVRLGRVFMRRL